MVQEKKTTGSEQNTRTGARSRQANLSASGAAAKRFRRRKYCRFSAEHMEYIDYKNYRLLREMLTERGKIKPRGATGTNAKFQRMLTRAIKRARQMALISPTKL